MSIHAVGSVEAQVAEGLRSSPRRTPLAAARSSEAACFVRTMAPRSAVGSVRQRGARCGPAGPGRHLGRAGLFRRAVDRPGQWLRFLAAHRWPDHDLAARIFGLAEDVALRSGYATGRFTAACI